MPSYFQLSILVRRVMAIAAAATVLVCAGSLLAVEAEDTPPVVVFDALTDGQIVSDLSPIGGTVTDDANLVASVVFSVREIDINGGPGRWWNGANYQSDEILLPATLSGNTWAPAPNLAFPAPNSGQSYELTATGTDSTGNSGLARITVKAPVAELSWDPGETLAGTVLLQNPNRHGGNYWFKIIARNTTVGAWRTALNVASGEADVFLKQETPPTRDDFGSARAGSDGFVLHASTFEAGQEWFILVHASPNAEWSLLTGEAFVHNLGALALDGSSGANVTMGAESMAFFKTTIDADTLAWSLWLGGGQNELRVRKSSVPHPASYEAGEPVPQNGQMLVVPDFLGGEVANGFYFVCVAGAPGEAVRLDSRKQTATDIPFRTTSSTIAVNDGGYRIFRVQVPVEQIAWEMRVAAVSGNPNVAVRRDKAPNEWNNDAFSEAAGSITDSVTLAPPGLSDGTFFITVYGGAPYSFVLQSANPTITDVPFLGRDTNADLNRVGWRFYRVTDRDSQLGSLGWELLLQNAPAGTEIALRRNAVPGRWNYRADNDPAPRASSPYVDYSSDTGELQRPAHQADIWYIGVYNASEALDSFTLLRRLLVPQPIAFESNIIESGVPSGHWNFYRLDVPANTAGWDVRLANVTAGNPRMVVRRDLLPDGIRNTDGWGGWLWPSYYPHPATSWPSGNQWAAEAHWNNPYHIGIAENRILAMGRGNPLEAGSYYIGVLAEEACSYTLLSRGIGAGMAIPVSPLEFAGGSANATVAAGEALYYQVSIPAGTPSWKVKLTALSGEPLLLAQKDAIPNIGAGRIGQGALGLVGGRKMQKAGNEHYVLLPEPGESALGAGTYYLAVAAETGNNSDFILRSAGALPVNNLGPLGAPGSAIEANNTLEGGEIAAYRFAVPPNTASIEIRLEDRAGNPAVTWRQGTRFPAPHFSIPNCCSGRIEYGNDGGEASEFQSDLNLITLANPAEGTHSVVVQAGNANGSDYPNASYRLSIRSVPPANIGFNGGSIAVTGQADRTWKFFQIDVPANTAGWDVRLANVTAGNPRLVVRRDLLPDGIRNTEGWGGWLWPSYYPHPATSWPSGNQWAAEAHWNHPYHIGIPENRILAMGQGNPLEGGSYYIGVLAEEASSYTLLSRGIGAGMAIPISPLEFAGGSADATAAAGEALYYRVNIPAGTPSWKVKLTALSGEPLLLAQKDAIPNIGAGRIGQGALGLVGGRKMQKAGNEHYVLLPEAGQSSLAAGTYHLAVAGETGNSSHFILESAGALPVNNLGPLGAPGSALEANATLEGGEIAAYRFAVPPNTASIEIRLVDPVGNPAVTWRQGTRFPAPHFSIPNCCSGRIEYGNDGGEASEFQSDLNLITLANPAEGTHSLVVQAASLNGSDYPNASYRLSIRSVPPANVSFDGGSIAVTGQADRTWKFFQIDVPANTAGWDVRLANVTAGNPRMAVRRDLLPDGIRNTEGWGGWLWPSYYPHPATSWPSGNQWAAEAHWNNPYHIGIAENRILAMGRGNPLEGGSYYIGVLAEEASSYTLQSRGIGAGMAIPISPLEFAGGSANATVAAGEAIYYRVNIPAGTPSWKVKLTALSGEPLLLAQKDAIPNIGAGRINQGAIGLVGGRKMQKAGNEHYVLLPEPGQSSLAAGTYYLAVAGETGNSSSFILESAGALPVNNLGPLGPPGTALEANNTLEGGEIAAYRFAVPPNTASIELRLEDRVGNPVMVLHSGTGAPNIAAIGWRLGGGNSGSEDYGHDAGERDSLFADLNFITVPNPVPGTFALLLQAVMENGQYPNSSYRLRVSAVPPPSLNFAANQNGNGLSNAAQGLLADNQRAFFRIDVPAVNNGAPVIGWKLDLTTLQGIASVRVRRDLLPADDGLGTSPYSSPSAYIVPPYLTTGTWYVEVRGSGVTEFTLTSGALTPERTWSMPEPGQPTTTPGLSGLEFGDSGTDANGNRILDPQTGTVTDQGIDLQQGRFHYYAIVVPENNIGLFRTTLEAISGNPDLYLRAGAPPTLSHGIEPEQPWRGNTLFDREQSGITTKYGNWTPIDGKFETKLAPGVWHLGVRAAGNSNARYRLHVAQGDVRDLALNGGSFSNQQLFGGDWRYYRVQIPADAPANWNVTFSQQSGDVVLYIRDTVPPGLGTDGSNYVDWGSDQKNQGPTVSFDPPGEYALGYPPLRPGHTYYLGFRAVNDATFSVSSATSGGTFGGTTDLAFYGGVAETTLPPNGSALYRIHVPGDAYRWRSYGTHAGSVILHLEQGTIPAPGLWSPHLSTVEGNQDAVWRIFLGAPNNWPWLPSQSYFLLVKNTSGIPQPFRFEVDGRTFWTDDENDDALPDYWQRDFFGDAGNWDARPDGDPDEDGLTNAQEFDLRTSPVNGRTRGRFTILERLPTGRVRLHLEGEAGQWYRFIASPDLAEWVEIGSVRNDTGTIVFDDPADGSQTPRFYQSVLGQ